MGEKNRYQKIYDIGKWAEKRGLTVGYCGMTGLKKNETFAIYIYKKERYDYDCIYIDQDYNGENNLKIQRNIPVMKTEYGDFDIRIPIISTSSENIIKQIIAYIFKKEIAQAKQNAKEEN